MVAAPWWGYTTLSPTTNGGAFLDVFGGAGGASAVAAFVAGSVCLGLADFSACLSLGAGLPVDRALVVVVDSVAAGFEAVDLAAGFEAVDLAVVPDLAAGFEVVDLAVAPDLAAGFEAGDLAAVPDLAAGFEVVDLAATADLAARFELPDLAADPALADVLLLAPVGVPPWRRACS